MWKELIRRYKEWQENKPNFPNTPIPGLHFNAAKESEFNVRSFADGNMKMIADYQALTIERPIDRFGEFYATANAWIEDRFTDANSLRGKFLAFLTPVGTITVPIPTKPDRITFP